MVEFIQSIPQGVFWYPVLLVVMVIAIRGILATLPRRRPAEESVDLRILPVQSYARLVRSASVDDNARAKLERQCIGLLLTGVGYRGYTIDNCRAYIAAGAPDEIASAIRGHLDEVGALDLPTGRHRGLPQRCEVIVRYIEDQMEEHNGNG